MSANIKTTDDRLVRPAWRHARPAEGANPWRGYPEATLEMMESARNVLEDIQQSQMLAYAIKDMAKALRRIDRRLAKLDGAKLK